MKKINFLCRTVLLFGLVLLFSCEQRPIFYTISTEPAPVKPLIQGSPTNIVVFERKGVPIMYVASGSLHWYAKTSGATGNPEWDSSEYNIPQPAGKVICLAATSRYLYALCIIGTGVSSVLRRIGNNNDTWEDMVIEGSTYTLSQSIFADNDQLFAVAMNNSGSDYGIFYLDGFENKLKLLKGGTELLTGAASRGGNIYYLSTRKGIYKSDFSTTTKETQPLGGTEAEDYNRIFMGMIKLDNNTIVAVERDGGAFFEVQESGIRRIRYSGGDTVATGRWANGTLALWQEVTPGGRKLLIAGINGGLYSSTTSSSYTHGYVEIDLEYNTQVNGWIAFTSARRDNTPSITVDGNTDRYTATIGKHPINCLFQAPSEIDPNMTFFASTQTTGLWSYRNRSGGPQWNAES